ncbi:MAG: hypothetical protein IPK07_18260 [Deltaproteobacteria bacterium]|nr:hypothetical protein [Deltaproteobacteria bacterium]
MRRPVSRWPSHVTIGSNHTAPGSGGPATGSPRVTAAICASAVFGLLTSTCTGVAQSCDGLPPPPKPMWVMS